MEKKIINYWYLLTIILVILVVIAGFKNLNNHHEKEYLVVNNKILESARQCYLKEECSGEITLKELYDKGYLETQIDPLTKENMDENICLKYEDNKALFCKK